MDKGNFRTGFLLPVNIPWAKSPSLPAGNKMIDMDITLSQKAYQSGYNLIALSRKKISKNGLLATF